MYPILILRSELACLVILVFLMFTSRAYKINGENKTFARILSLAIVHVLFDITTVITVNNSETVPLGLNWLFHVLFYLSAILYSNELVNYVIKLCYPKHAKKLYIVGLALTGAYVAALPFLKIDFVEDVGTYSSTGPAAYVGYGLAFALFITALIVIFTHWKKMSISIKTALIPMMFVLMVTEVCQIIWRSVLFTGGAITIVTVGFFFSLENPIEVFKKKAMTDALTGVRSRSSFDEDISKMDKRFSKSPNEDYIFVFCDLNGLRNVNNQFGHDEGDNYITLIASSINRCMTKCDTVYRIGGDEFLILYTKTDEDVVEQEIKNLQASCAKASEKLSYTAGVSAGYAKSSKSYHSLRDVVKTADYAMYQNKSKLHGSTYLGTKLNYAGLTDKIFDAMCASNDRNYPFITNLETNVTRIAPGWKEYFGLDSEFYEDFISMWKERIHPDYFEGYMNDVVAVLSGRRKYHNFDYLAKRADGVYVKVSCHGSVYNDTSTNTTFFNGFITNYGLEENTDKLTGLKNFDVITSIACQLMDSHKPFSVMKLKLNNFSHINMLYGYNDGNEIIKKIASILCREAGKIGRVFCQSSVNFTVLFDTCDERMIENYYKKISEILSAGIEIEKGTVPVLISGGAISNHGEQADIEKIRGNLVYALEKSHYYQRNKLVFYHDVNEASASGTDISLLAQIHADALADMKYFKLRYQPIVDVASQKTVGAEALLRWIHPKFGEIPPAKFIAFIENDPCYYRLGLEIIRRAIADSKQIQEKIPGFRININITALQLQNENFADDVFEILDAYGFAPNELVLELTERCKEMDSKFLAKKIAELRQRGLLVAFDDLGTGYSTISLLMDIPVDEIKLDREFVRDLAIRENYQLFVKALVLGSTTAGNNYTICFEGIENEEMFKLVGSFGNFLVQGYYFSKPLLLDEFNNYISTN